MRAASCLLLCMACHGTPPAGEDLPSPADLSAAPAADGRPAEDAAPGDLAPQCRSDKLSFTQAAGCQNDGSVEFCLPAGDDALLLRAQGIAPSLRCAPGGGRAGCKAQSELLCFFPTGAAECTSPHGALTDAAWARLCLLAALPEVRRIVPTFFE